MNDLLPASELRVPQSTAPEINDRIRRQIDESVSRVVGASPETIDARLRELDAEWDIERVIEANASTVIFSSLILGVTVDRRWLAITGLASAFLFQHALQGWCPPIPILRRLGVRTAGEIHEEKTALRVLRGDFLPAHTADDALSQVRAEHVDAGAEFGS